MTDSYDWRMFNYCLYEHVRHEISYNQQLFNIAFEITAHKDMFWFYDWSTINLNAVVQSDV